MIADAHPKDCYVYITLPGETFPVTAGRFESTTLSRGGAGGRFVYGRAYRQRPDAVSIDPTGLEVADRIYETNLLRGMFGAFRDGAPDFWGRRIIERHFRNSPLSELDYLLQSPDDRAGALGFGLSSAPPAPLRAFNQVLDLEKLQRMTAAIIADEDLPETAAAGRIEELLLLGTAMGGARPKTVVEDDQGLWLAKFNRPDDPWNMARVEHAMLRLARICGLDGAESKVVTTTAGGDVLLVKRFDRDKAQGRDKAREGYLRHRMVSALTLLRADDTYSARDKWSYLLLAAELLQVCAEPQKNALELFRRMCFNALISNTDDHPRNHAVIASGDVWRLSPAYDLTPSTPVSAEHRDLALVCGDSGRFANARNFISQSSCFLLAPDFARSTIDALEACVRDRWYATCRAAGVTEPDCDKIAGAFVYPGFRA